MPEPALPRPPKSRAGFFFGLWSLLIVVLPPVSLVLAIVALILFRKAKRREATAPGSGPRPSRAGLVMACLALILCPLLFFNNPLVQPSLPDRLERTRARVDDQVSARTIPPIAATLAKDISSTRPNPSDEQALAKALEAHLADWNEADPPAQGGVLPYSTSVSVVTGQDESGVELAAEAPCKTAGQIRFTLQFPRRSASGAMAPGYLVAAMRLRSPTPGPAAGPGTGDDGVFTSLQILGTKAPAQQPVPGARGPKETAVHVRGMSIPMVLIPPGTFRMGSATGPEDEKPVHTVKISHAFWMAKYPVTRAQWIEVMGYLPGDNFEAGLEAPVTAVSWDDCGRFIARLNRMGLGSFRLPTEAEWEYACRAGREGDYGPLDPGAWDWNQDGTKTHPVGQKAANAWGLGDLIGNVYQWCQDRYGTYPDAAQTDPQGAASGSERVARGGDMMGYDRTCKAASREREDPASTSNLSGFRLVRTSAANQAAF